MNTGSLKIIDFGLSKHRDSAKTVGIGTPDYMSPEMLSRAGGVGGSEHASYDPEAVDVWAMGVMLYLILTGVYPFEDVSQPGNITATLRRVREGRMNKLPSTSAPPCARLARLHDPRQSRETSQARGDLRTPMDRRRGDRGCVGRLGAGERRCRWRIVGWRAPGPRADKRGRGMRPATRQRYLHLRRPRRSRRRSALQECSSRWRLDRFHLRRTHHVKILRVLPLAGGLNDAERIDVGSERGRSVCETQRVVGELHGGAQGSGGARAVVANGLNARVDGGC